MKKLFGFGLVIAFASTLVLVACDKGGQMSRDTTDKCRDSAWLMADSLVCPGKNFFRIDFPAPAVLIAVPTGTLAIDTIVGNADFAINYQLTGGSTTCNGATYLNAVLTCYQRKQ